MPSRAVDTPIGTLGIVGSDDGLSRVLWSAKGLPEDSCAVLDDAAAQLDAYFAGELERFDVPLAVHGTDFQKRVWDELVRIPFGETISYSELARRLGDPKLVRAVGLANGRNPIAIIQPCHRVIGADGSLTGYGWGVDRKEWLLRHEGVYSAADLQPTLFG
jgi:methylated-DNA-[protein]-cysteine S-methyltransferase